LVGAARASFLYADPVRHVTLRTLRLSSLVLDGRLGTATLRGRCMQTHRRRAVGVTIVLTTGAAHGSLRIRLSNGYFKSGPLLKGAITFMRGRGSTPSITHRGLFGAAAAGNGGPRGRSRGAFEW
jgi:hypothetical protein